MNIRELVQRRRGMIKDDKIFFAPSIPARKLRNAIKAYAPGVMEKDVLVLIDSTIWGSAKDGALLTGDTLYSHDMGEEPRSISLSDISSAVYGKENVHLYVNDERWFIKCGLPEPMQMFAQMICEAGAALRPQPPVPPEVPVPDGSGDPTVTDDIVGFFARGDTSVTDGKDGVAAACLPRVIFFLKGRLREKLHVYFAPRIPPEKEQKAREAFKVPDRENMLVLVSDSSKNGVLFTDTGMYVKNYFAEPVAVPYTDIPACPYNYLLKIMPVAGSLDSKEMGAIAQAVKNIVMFGEPDARPVPPGPDEDPHPVRNWFIFAGTFVVFVILVPGLLIEAVTEHYRTTRSVLVMASMLSWFAWFHSHRVKARKAQQFALATVIRKTLFGVLCAALFAGFVLMDKFQANPRNIDPVEILLLFGISFLCVILCMMLFFKVQEVVHGKRIARTVRRAAGFYIEHRCEPGETGLRGLLDAGVCELDTDADIREVCRIIAGLSAHPFGRYRNMLEDVDLIAFFEHARDRGYDFVLHGKPEDVAMQVSRRQAAGTRRHPA